MNLTRLGVLLSVVVACLSQVKAFVLTRPDRKGMYINTYFFIFDSFLYY